MPVGVLVAGHRVDAHEDAAGDGEGDAEGDARGHEGTEERALEAAQGGSRDLQHEEGGQQRHLEDEPAGQPHGEDQVEQEVHLGLRGEVGGAEAHGHNGLPQFQQAILYARQGFTRISRAACRLSGFR